MRRRRVVRGHGGTRRLPLGVNAGSWPGSRIWVFYSQIGDRARVTPRHCVRPRVAASSVGMRDARPHRSRGNAGGWQLIGRTPLKPLIHRATSFLNEGGRFSQFYPIERGRIRPRGGGRMSGVWVVKAGMLTTIQDGRPVGLPVWWRAGGGPMDPVCASTRKPLVGNERESAALEITLLGPELRIRRRAARGRGPRGVRAVARRAPRSVERTFSSSRLSDRGCGSVRRAARRAGYLAVSAASP